jgi:hypothetical protein
MVYDFRQPSHRLDILSQKNDRGNKGIVTFVRDGTLTQLLFSLKEHKTTSISLFRTIFAWAEHYTAMNYNGTTLL